MRSLTLFRSTELFCSTLLIGLAASFIGIANASELDPVLVFILAGQSNMEGQGVVDYDHPQYYNGGKGNLEFVMRNSVHRQRYGHLRNEQGGWVVRDDVWIRFQTERHGLKKGGLGIGYTSYPGKHHIGPELQIGHQLGNHLKQQVLLIKTAWGGKSLHKDFRPPSAGGTVGPYYTRMVTEVRQALSNISHDFPTYDNRGHQLAGFVWFQGWNDMFDAKARDEYDQNLVYLIQDVRKELGVPKLPVVIGELGNGGEKAGANTIAIRQAQKAAATQTQFKNTVRFIKTTQCARPKDDSPNTGHGHHWFGNAESYFLIGDALGKAMVELLGNNP